MKSLFLILISTLISNPSFAAESIDAKKQIIGQLGCQAAMSSDTVRTLICFRNDVLDSGLETETKGCSVRLYDLDEKKIIGFNPYDKKAEDEILLVPFACESGGVQQIFNWPVDEVQTLKSYIKVAFSRSSEVIDLSAIDSKALTDLISEINSENKSRLLGPESAAAPTPRMGVMPVQASTRHTTVDVFFGTDRQYVAKEVPANTFSESRSREAKVTLGKLSVSIPIDHKYGNLELPSVFKIIMSPSPDHYMVVKSIKRLRSETFFNLLSKRVESSPRKDAFVFIHGFNTSFNEAAIRTAQMAFDLKFAGAPVFYSWPAETILRYAIAEKNVEWSLPQITNFLRDLAQKTGAKEIHLIAHSMGNRALTNALNKLAQDNSLQPDQKFQNVILAAPDVSQSLFRQIENSVKSMTQNLTLYASDKDKALQISARIHGEPRLGQAGENTVVLPSMETVDATLVDSSFTGHAYYGDSPNVISDIGRIITDAIPASLRAKLTERRLRIGELFWQIVN
jgi:esterase/lipase superfamily enzyme